MKKFIPTLIGFAVLGYLAAAFVMRLFFGAQGDPIVPLLAIIVIIIGSAIFQQQLEARAEAQRSLEDIAEIKKAAVVFLQQARTESELLTEMAKYFEILNNPMMEVTQRPDLN